MKLHTWGLILYSIGDTGATPEHWSEASDLQSLDLVGVVSQILLS